MRTSCSLKSSVGRRERYPLASALGLGNPTGLMPRQFPLKTILRLIPQRIMDARENDDDAIAGIHGTRGDSRVVCRLAALDVADHQSAPLKRVKAHAGRAYAART